LLDERKKSRSSLLTLVCIHIRVIGLVCTKYKQTNNGVLRYLYEKTILHPSLVFDFVFFQTPPPKTETGTANR
jgi:hypothetical protein